MQKSIAILVTILILILPLMAGTTITLVEKQATKKAFVPHEDSGTAWRSKLDYDDSDWKICEGLPGGIGYEKGTGYEQFISLDVGDEMHDDGGNANTGCYIRIPFNLSAQTLEKILVLQLKIRYDDGFIAYINGHECTIMNASRFAAWNYSAPSNNEATSEVTIDISNYIRYLVPGENLLAIHGVNMGTSSSDFLILPELVGTDVQFEDFAASPLPIFMIDTDGEYIPDEAKIDANLKITYHGEGELNHPSDSIKHYDGNIGIEIRGSYSATFPQKPYGIETRDEAGENLNISLLGFAKENDWILIPNYNDKAFVRNSLAFEMFRSMGHYAPRSKLCEVFVNNTYRGIYLFTEKIKRDKNRVDVSKLEPDEISGDDLTGGYIIKIDYYSDDDSFLSDYTAIDHPENKVYFVYHDPKPDELADEQKDYIQNFINNLEGSLRSEDFADPENGYRKYLDVNSFIDYFLVSEVSRNVDGYKKSRFFYKDKDSKGGLLHAGPVWDFDWAWKNISEGIFAIKDGSGWSYSHYPCWPSPPYWYNRLLQDEEFTDQLINRYFELREGFLDPDNINSYIDSVVALVDDVKERHFELWPIDQGYMTPETDPPSYTYEQEINKLKTWIETRIHWLDEYIPQLRSHVATDSNPDNPMVSRTIKFSAFPNPARFFLNIEADHQMREIKIYNLQGRMVYTASTGLQQAGRISIQDFPAGIYFVKISFINQKPIIFRHLFVE
ncbi:MAG: CotH kinase family protein [Candidatus Marinimicrobia bacterium]|nr:CotH kinase family protein [Candidatus Neomarinimicrobiota bacterium]